MQVSTAHGNRGVKHGGTSIVISQNFKVVTVKSGTPVGNSLDFSL